MSCRVAVAVAVAAVGVVPAAVCDASCEVFLLGT